MKRCPQCGRDYNDPTLSFCLDDGAELLYGPASRGEPQTAILPDGGGTTESPARTLEPAEAEATKRYADQVGKAPLRKGMIVAGIVGALLVAALGIGGYWFYIGGSSDRIDSIAVMPFVNESGNEDVEYLSDGMTETLINSLTEIPNLSVKARSTVFYYKGKNATPKQIGDELKVEAVLLGRIVQRGQDLKLSLELVDTQSLDAIWSETYDRTMSDLVSLQSEVARTVSDKLRLKLTPAEQKQVAKTYTTNSEAQRLYLKGRFYWNKRATDNFEKAEEYFKQAIEKDPNYALAYTGLADTYALILQYGDFRPKDYYPRAKLAAQKALELDDQLAEAHNSLANIFQTFEYDQANAEKEYKRAIELNPNYSSARHWYGEFLSIRGEHDRALAEVGLALKHDPFSRVINRSFGYTLYAGEKYDEAIEQLKKSTKLFPDDSWGHVYLGDTYAAKGDHELAVVELLTYLRLEGKSAAALQDDRSAYVRNWRIAQMYAGVGNKDKAIEYLKEAIDEHEPDVIYVPTAHYYDFMRDDPQFVELMKRVGLRVNN
ncbi:MAG: tetratricopeptide repeat protein [Pyrinomonadaceae bacterium]